MRLILASLSPRRKALLASLRLRFRVQPGPELDEAAVLAGLAGALHLRLQELARCKGAEVARAYPQAVVLSADTEVVLDDVALGKPGGAPQAREMLARLSGRTHRVLTAVCVQRGADGYVRTGCESTSVSFHALAPERIARYVALAQPYDYAGGYAIQGLGALLVRRISGDYANVVGLPLGLTARLLAGAGITVL